MNITAILVPCPICGTLYDGQYVYCNKCVAEQEREYGQYYCYDPTNEF